MVTTGEQSVERDSFITTFEAFSNELFFDIFAYLDGYALYKAFSHLNQRFDDLLSVQTLKLTSDSFELSDGLEDYFSLVSEHHDRFVSLFSNRMDVLRESFVSLQALVLSNVSFDMFECYYDLLFKLPRLHHLDIRLSDHQQDLSGFFRMMLHLPTLKSFATSTAALQTKVDIPIDSIKALSPIQHLVLRHSFSLNDLQTLVSFLPKLKSLSCERVWQPREVVLTHSLFTCSNLTHLSIRRLMLDFPSFSRWLQHKTTRLRSLDISVHENTSSYFRAGRWEHLFNQMNLTDLKKLRLDFHKSVDDCSQWGTHHQQLQQFSSPYWIEQDWKFELKVHWYYGVQYEVLYRIVSTKRQLADSARSSSNTFIPSKVQSSCLSIITPGPLGNYRLIVSLIERMFEPIGITALRVNLRFIDLHILQGVISHLPHLTTLHVMYEDKINFRKIPADSPERIVISTGKRQIIRLTLQSVQEMTSIEFFLNLCSKIEFLQIDSIAMTNFSTLFPSVGQKFAHPFTLCVVTRLNDCPAILAQLRRMMERSQFEIVRQNDRIYLNVV